MSTERAFFFRQGCARQHGAALMVMLVIMIIGAAAILVSALSSSSLQIERDKTTAAALAQARDALIGRAVADITSPGSLPCPDIDDTGIAQSTVGQPGGNCPNYIGRLPWKTLGLPDLRDGSGERLWYALSPNFRDYVSLNHINSDSQGTLTISGTLTANNVIAIVFSPGSTLSGQSRSATQSAACTTTGTTVAASWCATNYLEGRNADPRTATSPNTTFQSAGSTFNDQMITITHDQLFQPVETRIGREAKNCLDDYAASSSSKYPWAAPVSDSTNTGTYNTLFGRLSSTPNINIHTGSGGNGSSAQQSALINAGNNVVSLKNSVAGVSSNTIDNAGDYGKDFAQGNATYSTTMSYYNAAVTALAPYLSSGSAATTLSNALATMQSAINAIYADSPDIPSMSANWPVSCTLFTSTYWPYWQNEVFYQVASGFQPGSSANFGTPLTINGSGAYRATVIVARQAFPSQTPRIISSDTTYLEAANQHQTTPSSAFVTYSPSTASYSTVNDLVLCLDGAGTNPGSVCK